MAAFQVEIANNDSWQREIIDTPGLLQVVECYKDWCGPCKAIVSPFRRICLDLSDSPLKFYTVNVDKIDALADFRETCKPRFLFYKDGKLLEEVSGVNYPKLSDQIKTLLW